ncbi:MAG: Crp/Fnr family transcriptional regulator [Bacteroidetes bacterium]|nr:Crp/Fnr family transcriptional regulator [Bacteroidota bacterium]
MSNITAFNSCSIESGSHWCFDNLSSDEKAMIEKTNVVIKYKKGEIFAKQGAFASHVIFLKEGLAKIFLEENQKTLILKIIPSENIIGLTSLLEGNTVFQYSAQAYQDSIVHLVDINVFRKLIKMNAKFASCIINILTENAIQTYGRFFCLTQKQSYGRFADILCCLSERIYKQRKFQLLLSRKELAELTGLSVESVSRMIKEFKNDGIMKFQGKDVEITDFVALKRISVMG